MFARSFASPGRVLARLAGPLVVVLALQAAPVSAQPRDSGLRYGANLRGDLSMAANNLLTCRAGTTSGGVTCEQARRREGVAKNNNAYVMDWIDADDDAGTFVSSGAGLTLPSGADVKWAGLYWTCNQVRGEASPDPARFAEVKLRTPVRAYTTVTASVVDDGIAATSSSGAPVTGLAEVTELVREGGAGTYWLADAQCSKGATGLFGGWALVVAYGDATAPLRNLSVFDLYQKLSRGAEVDFLVSGFVTPASGAVRSRVGYVVGDGDQASSDGALILSDTGLFPLGGDDGSLNPASDVANGTISSLGVNVTARTPADANTFGFDADLMDGAGALPNRATDAIVIVDADVESLVLGVVTFSTEVNAPELTVSKVATDLNGAPLRPGDLIEYAIDAKNGGLDRAINIVLTDTITPLASLVTGSITIDGAARTEAVDSDAVDWDAATKKLTVRLAPTGGLSTNQSTRLVFRVKVNDPLAPGAVVENQAAIEYAGDTLGANVKYQTKSDGDATLDGLQPTLVVAANTRPVLAAKKTAHLTNDRNGNTLVDPGDELAFDIVVTNQGDAPATNVVVTDPIDPHLELVRVRTNQGTVTSGTASPVRAELGTVVPGGAPSVTIYTNVRRPFPVGVEWVSNQAVVEAANAARVVSDDTGTVLGPDETRVSVDGRCDCFVDARCFDANERNPANFCEVCSPSTVATRWSAVQSDTCDADGDTIPDTVEKPGGVSRDTDQDGTPDHLDTDDDGDEIPTRREASEDATPDDDTDRDSTPSWLDTDSDGDGKTDKNEGVGDSDNDGVPDYLDAFDGEEEPTDGGTTSGGGYAGGGLSCNSGGAGWLAIVGVFLGFLRRRRLASVAAAGFVVFTAVDAHAAGTAFELDRFRTAEVANDGFALSRPTDLGHLRGSALLLFDYARNPLMYETKLGDPSTRVAVVDNHLVGQLSLALGLLDRVTVYAGVPVSLVMTGAGGPGITPADGTIVGDPSVGLRGRLLGESGDVVHLGAQLTATFPVAGLVANTQHFAGESGVVFLPKILAELQLGAVRVTANVGARLRGDTTFSNLQLGPELTAALGAGVAAVPDKLDFLVETYASSTFTKFLARELTPWEVIAGLRFRPVPEWSVSLGGGPGLSSGYGTPTYRLLASIAFSPPPAPPPVVEHAFEAPAPPPVEPEKPRIDVAARPLDSDGDGLFDANDQCPDQPEDADGFQDDNGCPDADNDEDGLPDTTDSCRDEAEDRDGYMDDDGCPDPDNDRDGLEDGRDKCPGEAEDLDGQNDEDGCPDYDDDGDGILDALDDCAQEPEDKDGFRDEDGCPDFDNDNDLLEDKQDQCPNEAGPKENAGCPDPDTDGDTVVDRLDNCPNEKGSPDNAGCKKKQLIVIRKERIELLDSVYFKTAKDVIEHKSFKLLDQVVALLVAHPELKRVRIEGHTDDVGDPAKNKDLSQRRAQSIVRYLTKRGVDPVRLEAVGYGQDKPIVPNDSKKNRAKNRRVEFIVVDLGGPADVQKQQNDVGEDTID